MRLNFLHPPFNNVDARKAHALPDRPGRVHEGDSFGNPKYYKKCPSNFACGTPMENDENTDWFKERAEPRQGEGAVPEGGLRRQAGHGAARDQHRLHEQFRATRRAAPARCRHQCAARLVGLGRRGHAPRREGAAGSGRLEHLHHLVGRGLGRQARSRSSAIRRTARRAGSAGRPTKRTRSCATNGPPPAASTSRRRSRARCRSNDWNFVPHVWLGQWLSPVAYRKNLRGVLAIPEIIPFWNIEKA